VDINGGWSDSENLIAGGPTDLEEDSDTILEIVLDLTQNQLVR